MSARAIPEPLYSEVFAIATDIANAELADDTVASVTGLERLRTLYRREAAAGRLDPFLTETLADFTVDAAEAQRLYGLALRQCDDFPDEVRYTKRVGLARALFKMGNPDAAVAEVALAKEEAKLAKDDDALEIIQDLVDGQRSNNRLERQRHE